MIVNDLMYDYTHTLLLTNEKGDKIKCFTITIDIRTCLLLL